MIASLLRPTLYIVVYIFSEYLILIIGTATNISSVPLATVHLIQGFCSVGAGVESFDLIFDLGIKKKFKILFDEWWKKLTVVPTHIFDEWWDERKERGKIDKPAKRKTQSSNKKKSVGTKTQKGASVSKPVELTRIPNKYRELDDRTRRKIEISKNQSKRDLAIKE